MICELCKRNVDHTSEHHLVPRTRHTNKWNKREFDRAVVKETADMCSPCHRYIHATYTEKTLEREYNTLDALRADPKIAAFLKWLWKHDPDGKIQTKQSKTKR